MNLSQQPETGKREFVKSEKRVPEALITVLPVGLQPTLPILVDKLHTTSDNKATLPPLATTSL